MCHGPYGGISVLVSIFENSDFGKNSLRWQFRNGCKPSLKQQVCTFIVWKVEECQQWEDRHPCSIHLSLWFYTLCSCFYPQVLVLVFQTLRSKPAVDHVHHVPAIGQAYVPQSVQTGCRSWTPWWSNCSETAGSGETLVSLWLAWHFFLASVTAALSFYFFLFFFPSLFLTWINSLIWFTSESHK